MVGPEFFRSDHPAYDEATIQLEKPRVLLKNALLFFEVRVESSLELGQKLLEQLLHTVAVFKLRLRPQRVHEMKGGRRCLSSVQHNLKLDFCLALGRYFLHCTVHASVMHMLKNGTHMLENVVSHSLLMSEYLWLTGKVSFPSSIQAMRSDMRYKVPLFFL